MAENGKEIEFDTYKVRPDVLETIVRTAACAVEGVTMPGSTGKRPARRFVSVGVEDGRLSVALHIGVAFGAPMRALSETVQKAVADALYNMTGWPVATVEVFVDAVAFGQEP